QIAKSNDVAPAEMDDRIAVAVRLRRVNELYTLAVEEVAQLHGGGVVRVGRLRIDRCGRSAPGWRCETHEHLLVGEDRGPLGRVRNVAGHVATGKRSARRAQSLVSADVIRSGAGVDDVATRLCQ